MAKASWDPILLTWIIHRDNERRGQEKIKGLNLHPQARNQIAAAGSWKTAVQDRIAKSHFTLPWRVAVV